MAARRLERRGPDMAARRLERRGPDLGGDMADNAYLTLGFGRRLAYRVALLLRQYDRMEPVATLHNDLIAQSLGFEMDCLRHLEVRPTFR